MRGRAWRYVAWTALAALWGCDADLPEGRFACASADDCPEGWVCERDLCFSAAGMADDGGGSGGDVDGGGSGGDGGGASGGDGGGSGTLDGGGGDASDAGTDGGARDAATDAGQDGGGTDAGRDGGEDTCPSTTHVCAAAVPAGWNGPVAVASASNPPGCPDAYPDTAVAGAKDLQFDPANCRCTCGAPSGVECANKATLTFHAGTNCITLNPQKATLYPGQCEVISPPANTEAMSLAVSLVAGTGACAVNSNHTLPPPSWTTRMRACSGGVELNGCGDGLCMPRPPGEDDFEPTLCIWREADAACPAGYGARTQYYQDFSEGRECTPCGCRAPTGASCSASASLYGSSCPDPGDVVLPPGPPVVSTGDDCEAASDSRNRARLGSISPQGGSCEPTGGVAQGTVTPKDIVTVCCM